MVCKCCGQEMLEGFIPTSGLQWLPKWEDMGKIWIRGPKENGFYLGGVRLFGLKKQPAWYCPRCEIILIDCKVTVN